MSARELITDHLDLWTGVVTKKSSSGRGSNGKVELTGIKKLRELILELAVRGSLVDQIPGGESAQELLERCLKAKAASVEQGKLKKARKHACITSEDIPFSLPHGWSWSRLDDLLRVINGRAYKKHEMLSSGTPLLRVGNLFTSNDWYYSDLELEEDKYIDSGDLIYAWSASFGPFIWDGGRAIYHYHIWKLDLFDESAISKQFLFLYLKAITEEIKSSGSGIAMIHMTKGKMEELVFPIPPLEEQHRIVQKVDELMALCDRLEQQTSDQFEAHETLVDTLLGTLTQSENATELADNWARLAAHFDALFTTEQSIEKLKQTILQLAVMGRLAHQDPSEEAASILLEKISNEMCQLTANKRTKKTSTLPPISDEELPFEKPLGWEAARLHSLIAISSGDGLTAAQMSNDGGIPVFGGNGVNGFHNKANVREPTLVIGRVGYYCGSIHITPEEAWVTDNAFITRYAREHISQRYLYWLLKATNLKEQDNATAQPVISGRKIYPIVVIIAPRLEQDRIAEKIDELMAICDQLKERLNQASETRCQLAEAVVEGALT